MKWIFTVETWILSEWQYLDNSEDDVIELDFETISLESSVTKIDFKCGLDKTNRWHKAIQLGRNSEWIISFFQT